VWKEGADSLEVHIGTPIPLCKEENEQRIHYKESDVSTSTNGDTSTSKESTEARTEAYTPATFENLVYRYEEPNAMARWDSPLFTVIREDENPPCEAIWDAMIGSDGKGRVVRSNAATVLVYTHTPETLIEMDEVVVEIILTDKI
jgi:protein KTI12